MMIMMMTLMITMTLDNENAGDDCDGDDYISGDWAKQTIVRKGPTTIKERRRLSRKTRCFNLDDVAESLRTISFWP